MNGLTTITTKGQVTIPEIVRQMLGASVGDKVAFTKIQPFYREAVIKIIPAKVVDELSGSLSSKVKISDQQKVRKVLKQSLLKKYHLQE